MGVSGSLCGESDQTSPFKILKNSKEHFFDYLKYYNKQINPVSNLEVQTYSFKEIFLQKIIYYFNTKQQLANKAMFLSECARALTGVQSLMYISAQKDIKCSSSYQIIVFSEFLNFSLKQHLDSLRFKGTNLTDKQIFYVFRQMILAANYLNKKKLQIKSFDCNDVYLNAIYEVKIPYENIQSQNYLQSVKYQNKKQNLYLAPQQLNFSLNPPQVIQFLINNPSISKVFSLGMLILECKTMLDSAVTYYNYFTGTININKLNQDIKLLQNNRLAAILSRMLQLDPRKRIKFKQLQNIVEKLEDSLFEQSILID